MRIALWLTAALVVASAVAAQDVIEWSGERRLAKEDFKGRVPASASRASLSSLNIDVSWQCQGSRLVANARATFDPGRSWWLSAQGNIWEGVGERTSGVSRSHLDVRRSAQLRDMQLLEHEQLHFDLTEIAVRKIRKRFEDLKGACADPAGPVELQPFVAEIDRELQEEQRRYDRETDHGTNAAAQEHWKRTIRPQLGLPAR
jgi:Bacterial protein of unknown function (DUF922)